MKDAKTLLAKVLSDGVSDFYARTYPALFAPLQSAKKYFLQVENENLRF